MTLTNELKSLKKVECPDGKCVLTVYLNTDPADMDQQKGEWKIRLKNGLNRIEEYIEASGSQDELKAYQKLKKQVDNEIKGNRPNLAKSVVIFASDHEDLWSVHYLQVPTETNFYWEPTPQLDELKQVQEKFPRSGIVMPNNDEVRIIDTSFGEVNEEWVFEFDSNKEEWNLSDGMASKDRQASSATHVDKFKQRFEENKYRFYKDMAQKVEKLRKEAGWHELNIVAEADAARTFADVLQTEPARIVQKNLNGAESSKILSEVFER
ncbi:VLRF1 family aeRF1-type release factor [Alkalicoccus chagannorensis]|uniref:VLRF1 family aeRF1-type release factor n=1 Tax=Alkalicoccus chagannorensis TaxID=427072 RepID=UPI0004020C6F|nr:VLRF1 family aeRF1-type release factor [Alkalicoccus chagannorensis]